VFKLVFPLFFLLLADGQGKDEAAKGAAAATKDAVPATKDGAAAKDEAPKSSGLFKTPPTKAEIEASRKRPVELEEKRPPRRSASSSTGTGTARFDREASGVEGDREGRGEPMGVSRDVAAASRRGGAGSERVPEGERVVTPSAGLNASAMHDELGQHANSQKAASERERLEILSADLARARSALREETTRLEGLMDKAKQAGVIKPGAPGAPAATGEGGAPPTMPVGDPLAPSAYFRPAPPSANFAVQVEVVSKAIKSMKPEQAAGVIGHLERSLAAEVLQRMRAADAGAILGFLKPEVAAALASEIVRSPPIGSKGSDKDKP
jgi:flagellar motility protein MotE (MotC chaperone)